MKNLSILIILIGLSFQSFGLTLPKTCTKTEKQTIRELIKKENLPVVEISKGSNTNWKVVVEFTTKMYVLQENQIEEVYLLDNEDWMKQLIPGKGYTFGSIYNTPIYLFNFDQTTEPYIEIHPINGDPTWTLYYQNSFYDSRIQATVYYNEDIMVTVGEDFVFYEDSLDSWRFEIEKCE